MLCFTPTSPPSPETPFYACPRCRLLNLPLTMRHGVTARQRSASKRHQQPDRLNLNKKTAVTIPLPGTAAEVQASLDVPCTVSLPRRPSGDAMTGSSTYGSPSSVAAACWDDNALLPVSASASSIELLLPPPAMWGPAAPESSPRNRRKVSFRVQPRGGRKPAPKPAKLQQEQYPSQQAQPREGAQQHQQQPKGGGHSCVPQLTVDVSLPEEWGHESCRIPVQDVSCSWRQAWGQRVSTSLRWQHVAVGAGGSSRRQGGHGKASGQAEMDARSSSSSSEASLNPSQAGSSAGSGGSSLRSSLESEVGSGDDDLSKAAPIGVPAALLAVPGRGGGGALGGGAGLFCPSTSLAAAAAAAAADAGTSAAEALALPSTWPKLQAELKCVLGSRVTATANVALDSGGLGRPWREWREPGTGHIKSAGVKLKFKLGSIGGKGGDGSSSSSGSKQSGGGKRSVTLQSSYNSAGFTHSVLWQHGSKDNPQRAQSEVKLQCQPHAKKASLDFEFYVPF